MGEFGPSPQSEEEKEALGVTLAEEIAALRRDARTDEDYEAIIRKAKEIKGLYGIESNENVDLTEAKTIFGQDFIGPEEIENAFLSKIEIGSVAPIPFSKEELERAKEMGQMLIYRASKTSDGSPLTMKAIGDILGGKVKDEGKIFFDTDWYKDEKFFTEDIVEEGWALVSKELAPDSTNKNYLEQTDLLVEQLGKSFGGFDSLPSEYVDAVQEYDSAKEEIAGLITSDWQKAAEKLENLKINQLLRQSPSEAIYDMMAYFQCRGERILNNAYTWTKRRASGGNLVSVGLFGSDGVGVHRYGPGDADGSLGVSFSRSH